MRQLSSHFYAVLAASLTLITAVAAVVLNAGVSIQEEYISKYSSIAVSEMKRTGVPASITLAQGLLESRAGKSPLAVKGNNHFGIKCHNDWKGKKMYQDDDRKGECFRVYKSPEDSYRDHSNFLRYKDRYKSLFALSPTNYKAWAKGLKAAGYATDPAYANKLIKVIEDYRLYRFDRKSASTENLTASEAVETPVAPLELEKAEKISPEVKEKLGFPMSIQEYKLNGVPFIKAVSGQTYSSIAAMYNLFPKELLAFNDRSVKTVDSPLKAGTIVYLQRKKNKAAKGVDQYVVGKDGENILDIAQRFAVRVKSLYKMNGLNESSVLKEGDTIRLR